MSSDALSLLIVCTANQCRSPLGEVIARDALARAGLEMTVGSAGTMAEEGLPPTDATEFLAKRMGFDLSEHESRLVDEEMVADASLVICMERAHVVAICSEWPDAYPRTFTLKDLARRAATTHRHPSEPLDHWLVRLGEDRVASEMLGRSLRDDVADPVGRSLRRHRKAAEEITSLLDIVIEQLNPPIAV